MAKEYAIHVCTLDYVEQSIQADRRIRKGDRQLYCLTCGKWRWVEECNHKNRITQKEHDRLVSAAEAGRRT